MTRTAILVVGRLWPQQYTLSYRIGLYEPRRHLPKTGFTGTRRKARTELLHGRFRKQARPLLPRHLQRCAALVRMLLSVPGIQPAPPFGRKLIGHSTSCDHPTTPTEAALKAAWRGPCCWDRGRWRTNQRACRN